MDRAMSNLGMQNPEGDWKRCFVGDMLKMKNALHNQPAFRN